MKSSRLPTKCTLERRSRQQSSRIERGQRRIRIDQDQGNFGAAKDHSIASLVLHSFHNLLKRGDRGGFENSVHQLVHDDAIDLLLLLRIWAHEVQVARLELFRVHLAVDQITGSSYTQAPKTAPYRLSSDRICYMQPFQWQSLLNVGQRLVY